MILKNKLDQIAQLINQGNTKNNKISAEGIYWHLDHSLIILINVSKVLLKSNPLDYIPSFNFKRSIIFAINFIPRGKGKAPKSVYPPDNISKEDLQKKLKEANQLLNMIIGLPKKSNFTHPLFGMLNLKQTIKFLNLHTEHHLKICRDINKG